MGAKDRPADGDSQYYEVKDEADDAQRRARRLELIVYASLVAFVVLAVYGFWLITSLTRDVSQLTEEISSMTRVVDRDMSAIVRHMEAMEGRMVDIAGSTAEMEQSVASISEDTGRMSTDIGSMTRDTEVMAGSVIGMQRDMWSLNRNVGGPMGMMNMFNPLSGQGGPYPGSGGPYRPPSAPR
ncbi:hypothetical protein [Thioalkalivibrio halophilus]|uniref:Translation initiation factor 2 n=1 Tax=Thioalkalivibrio halophilus TaxID=252474 RepID=A0A1V2ZZM5_9GAMM|nr:hypothetical protein [Thioalkalivibrio halophilus]OOC10516.1 hypothetical protein B1A74_05295 [Thioalkalivibrio halophilus]